MLLLLVEKQGGKGKSMMEGLPINQVLCGDAAELMRGLPDASIHAIVTDPPYGLEFMGAEWDRFVPKDYPNAEAWRGRRAEFKMTYGKGLDQTGYQDRETPKFPKRQSFRRCKVCGRREWSGTPCKCDNPEWKYEILDGPPSSMLAFQKWTTAWAREALRVLLPGASMLVMGGTRTYHRMACGVEDAGFEIKDTILWCYNSGFPKAQDLGKMIDRRLGAEREVVGKGKYYDRQPQGCQGDVTDYTKSKGERWGENALITAPATNLAREWDGWKVGGVKPSYEPVVWAVKPPEGSTTDNVLKHKVGAINIDACRIPRSRDDRFEYGVSGDEPSTPGKTCYGDWGRHTYEPDDKGRYPANMVRTDRFEDGYDRFYFIAKAERAERWFKCRICDIYQDGTHLGNHRAHVLHCHDCCIDFPNTDEEKEAHKNHRTESNIVAHPTVKPVALGEFLIKLVTREGQIVLDQFCGLGSFLVAARNLNRQYIGFDNGSEYYEIARRRLAAIPPPLEVFA